MSGSQGAGEGASLAPFALSLWAWLAEFRLSKNGRLALFSPAQPTF